MKDLHHKLVAILELAINDFNISVLETYRDEERQDKLFAEGKSQVLWPNSKHNTKPSRAVDICLWPQQFRATDDQWYELTDCIKMYADALGIVIQCGCDWSWQDMPHIQLDDSEE